MNFIKSTLLIAISVFFQQQIGAQNWTNYQSQQQINDLVETSTELLLATDVGLVVVNKATLESTVYDKSNTSLPSNHIQSITRDDSGKSWIGTYDMIIGYFDGSDFKDLTFPTHPANLDNSILYDLKVAPNGDFWMASNEGIFHKEGATWNHYAENELGSDFFEVWDIDINSTGEVFAASRNVTKFSNGVWTDISTNTNLEGYLDGDLFTSSSGDLYLSGDLDNIGRYDGQNWEEFPIDFNGSQVIGFTEDLDGNVFFFTLFDGIFKLENDTWIQQSNAQTQAANNFVNYYHFDQNNNSWLNNGIHLSVTENGTIRNTTISKTTLETNSTTHISKGKNGKMYFITSSLENFSVVDMNGNWSTLTYPPDASVFELYQDILVLSEKDIWVVSYSALHHFDGINWTTDSNITGSAIDVDSQGKIYVLGFDNISMIKDGIVTQYTPGNSMLNGLVLTAMGIDPEDNLWVGTGDFEEPNVIQKVTPNGVWTTYSALNHEAIKRPIGDFHFDKNGNIWVPEDVVGAIKFDGTDFSNPIQENISEIDNYKAEAVESDESGKVYFSTPYGVTTLYNGEFTDLPIPDLPTTNISSIGKIVFDDNGTLWWGSGIYGVFTYNETTINGVSPSQTLAYPVEIYPNPASGNTTMNFKIIKKANTSIYIFNNLGQLISANEIGNLQMGTYQKSIDVNQFTPGFYTIQLKLDTEIYNTKLIVE